MKQKFNLFLKKYSVTHILSLIAIFLSVTLITVSVNYFLINFTFPNIDIADKTLVSKTLLPIEILFLGVYLSNHVIDYVNLKKKHKNR